MLSIQHNAEHWVPVPYVIDLSLNRQDREDDTARDLSSVLGHVKAIND